MRHFDKEQLAARMMNPLHSREVRHQAYNDLMLLEWFEAVHHRGYPLNIVPEPFKAGVYQMLAEYHAPPVA